MRARKLPKRTLEVIDHAAIHKLLEFGEPVSFDCTEDDLNSIRMTYYTRFGKGLKTQTRVVEGRVAGCVLHVPKK